MITYKIENSYDEKIIELYIDLLKKSLIDFIDLNNDGDHDKVEGKGLYPTDATKTMIGLRALNNIEYCINDINKNKIEGDFIEAGVWRGGATIFMKALSDIFGMNRTVFVADAFENIFPVDSYTDECWHDSYFDPLSVSLDVVKNNFRKYNVLDDNVKFLKGWFKDTLDTPDIKKISLLRLDGDLYSSTMDTLNALYSKVEIGGYIIVDDYNALPQSKQAIDSYRKQHNITAEMFVVNWACVYWKKEK